MDNKEKGPEAGSTSPRLKAFQATSWAFLVFLYLFSPATSLLLGWFVDFEDNISHRVHEVTFGALFTLVIVGIAAQLRSPARNIAGIQQAIVVTVTFTAVVAASTGWEWTALLYVGPAVAIGVLHPERSQVFRVRLRFERRLRNLMLLATPGFLFSFADEFAKAADGVRDHTTHWGAMAAFALATRPDRIPRGEPTAGVALVGVERCGRKHGLCRRIQCLSIRRLGAPRLTRIHTPRLGDRVRCRR